MKQLWSCIAIILVFGACKEQDQKKEIIANKSISSQTIANDSMQTALGPLKAHDIPKGISYKGDLINSYNWVDRSGEHLLILSETGVFQNPAFDHEMDGGDAELFATHYILNKSIPVQTWKIYDFIRDCPVDLNASFVEDSFRVTDLNNNGLAEIWIAYTTVCHGDVSPSTLKLMMYEGNKKHAMRGETMIFANTAHSDGGTYTMDQSFKAADDVIKDYAMQLWNESMVK